MNTEVVIAVKEPPKDLKAWTICGIGADVLEVLPKNHRDGFLVKFVDENDIDGPIYRVRVMTRPRNAPKRPQEASGAILGAKPSPDTLKTT